MRILLAITSDKEVLYKRQCNILGSENMFSPFSAEDREEKTQETFKST